MPSGDHSRLGCPTVPTLGREVSGATETNCFGVSQGHQREGRYIMYYGIGLGGLILVVVILLLVF